MTTEVHPPAEPLDLVGIGIGPFNLSLAALSDGVTGLRSAFLERQQVFRWHPGLLIDGTTLQVPFLADLVSLVDPSSRWSFLNYLCTNERLFPFYFAERSHIYRTEYDAYCRWVSGNLQQCRFGHVVEAVDWDEAAQSFVMDYTHEDPARDRIAAGRLWARNVVVGIGTEPAIPAALRDLIAREGSRVFHSAEYLDRRDGLLSLPDITVVGSGQSGAEIFLDLLRARPVGREGLRWITRTPAFAPMEYSKLGLEQFTPDYTRFFHQLPHRTRQQLLPQQWQLYKAISADTIAEIHDELYRRAVQGQWPDALLAPATAVRASSLLDDRIKLDIEQVQQGQRRAVTTDAVILATGYQERPLDQLLGTLASRLARDPSGEPLVDADYRLTFTAAVAGSMFVQNAERHSHGVGAPDLGLAAWRSAVILNALTGRNVYRLPERTAFTTFGIDRLPGPPAVPGAAAAPSTASH
jgi:lysine N6-hydroxylase